MSYQNWACWGWMLPATIENAQKLGITAEEIKDKIGEPDPDLQDELEQAIWWDEAIETAGMDSISLTGHIGNKDFSIYVQYISSNCDLDSDMDSNIRTYFAFNFDDLYKPTALHNFLERIGMQQLSWVDGG